MSKDRQVSRDMAAKVDPSDPLVLKDRQERGKCSLYLEKKRRFCNMNNHKGSIYCFNHAPNSAAIIGKPSPAKKARTGRQRIPCPLDPNHCVWEDKLQRHLRVCEAAKRASTMASLPYVRPGINLAAPGSDSQAHKQPLSAAAGAVPQKQPDPPRGDATLLQQLTSASQLKQIFEDLLRVYDGIRSPTPTGAPDKVPSHDATAVPATGLLAEKEDPSTAWRPPVVPLAVAAAERHTLQQEALVELMAHTYVFKSLSSVMFSVQFDTAGGQMNCPVAAFPRITAFLEAQCVTHCRVQRTAKAGVCFC